MRARRSSGAATLAAFAPSGPSACTRAHSCPLPGTPLPLHRPEGLASAAAIAPGFPQAVGIGLGPVGTAGTSAAIKWITKDGLGAVGRLFVGGKLSRWAGCPAGPRGQALQHAPGGNNP